MRDCWQLNYLQCFNSVVQSHYLPRNSFICFISLLSWQIPSPRTLSVFSLNWLPVSSSISCYWLEDMLPVLSQFVLWIVQERCGLIWIWVFCFFHPFFFFLVHLGGSCVLLWWALWKFFPWKLIVIFERRQDVAMLKYEARAFSVTMDAPCGKTWKSPQL